MITNRVNGLVQVLLEAVDLPKTYNSVYGVGAGTTLDSEILIYMKSQGWPERVQVRSFFHFASWLTQ